MEFRRRSRRSLNLELNIINLIDILVVIIVFLMVTTYGTMIGTIRARLPAAATADTMSGASPFVIMVTREGSLYVGEHAVAGGTAHGPCHGQTFPNRTLRRPVDGALPRRPLFHDRSRYNRETR